MKKTIIFQIIAVSLLCFSFGGSLQAATIVSWGGNTWGQITNTPDGNDFVEIAMSFCYYGT